MLLLPIVAVAGSLALTSTQSKRYASMASVLFTNGAASFPGSSGDLAGEPARFLQTQAEVVLSAPVRDAAEAAAGGSFDYAVDPVFDADVLEVHATAATAELAAAGANAAVKAYLELRGAQAEAGREAATTQLSAQITTLDGQIAAIDQQAAGAAGAAGLAGLQQQRGALVDARAQMRVALARGDQPLAATGLAAAITGLDAEIVGLDAQITAAAAAAPPTAALDQQRASLVTSRTDLQNRLNSYSVDAALAADSIRVLAPAEVQGQPTSPHPLRSAAFALVVGMLAGLGLALLIGRASRPVGPSEDLRGGLPGVPVLAELGGHSRNGLRPGAAATTTGGSELRAALTDPDTVRPPRRIQITSSVGILDTSVVAADLAAAFAEAGLRALVVDCNLRRPGLAAALGLHGYDGVCEVLQGEAVLTDVVLGAPGRSLGALTAGRAGATADDLLGGVAFEQMLAELSRDCDVLVVDTPAVGDSADAVRVSGLVDTTLVVAASGRTSMDAVREALDLLERAGANVGGLVLIEDDDAPRGGATHASRVAVPTTGAPTKSAPRADLDVSDVDDRQLRYGTPG